MITEYAITSMLLWSKFAFKADDFMFCVDGGHTGGLFRVLSCHDRMINFF